MCIYVCVGDTLPVFIWLFYPLSDQIHYTIEEPKTENLWVWIEERQMCEEWKKEKQIDTHIYLKRDS